MERYARLEGFVQRGEFVQALNEFQQLVLLPDLTPKENARVLRLGGRAVVEISGPYAGIKCLEMAIPLALHAKDWDCLGTARADLGSFWLMTGDYGNAVEYLQAYLLDYARYDVARGVLGHVHYNLALALRHRYQFHAAVEHYERAVAWFTEKGYVLQAGSTHQNLAWMYCLLGRLDEAGREIDIAETFAPVCDNDFRMEQMVCRAFLLRLMKQVRDALLLVQEVLHQSRKKVSPAHKGNAAWVAGSIALDLRQYRQAVDYAGLATRYGLLGQDPSIMSLASKLKAEAHRRMVEGEEAAQ